MALGAKTDTIAGDSFAIEILASVTAANGAPASASAGVEMNALRINGEMPTSIRVGFRSTAGSATMTVAGRVWLYMGGAWSVAATLNGGSNIAETSADAIAYSEAVSVVQGAARIFLEVTAIAGTSTAVTGYAYVGR